MKPARFSYEAPSTLERWLLPSKKYRNLKKEEPK